MHRHRGPGKGMPVITDQGRLPSRWVTALLVVAVAVVVAGVTFFHYLRLAPAPGSVELSSIPEGVSARRVDGTPVFIVRDDRAFTVFLTDPQHLPGEHVLWWCPSERLFASPTHGELFDERGRAVVDTPAARGLSRLEATVRGGTLFINVEGRVESTAPRQPRSVPAAEGGEPWDSGPGSFCYAPIRSDQT